MHASTEKQLTVPTKSRRPSRVAFRERGRRGAARRFRPAFSSRKDGVSEVIGNILVLGITVTMFSTVFLWVGSLPAPTAKVGVTFGPTLAVVGGGGYVNITHTGGETLKTFETDIRILVDTSTTFYKINDGGLAAGTWSTGQVWTKLVATITATSDVELIIISKKSKMTLLDVRLQSGTTGNFPPFVANIFTLAVGSNDRDKIVAGDDAVFFAQIADPDKDVDASKVKIDLSSLGLGSGWVMTQSVNDKTMFYYDPPGRAGLLWDEQTVTVSATDLKGNTDSYTYTIHLSRTIVGPQGPRGPAGPPNNGTSGGGNGTWNSTLGNITFGYSGPSGDYGYDIYNNTGLPSLLNPSGNSTRVFYTDVADAQHVSVIVRSTVLQAPTFINSFIIRNATTGLAISPQTKEFDATDGTKTTPAFGQTKVAPYFEYLYEFDTNRSGVVLPVGAYPVEIRLKDNIGHTFIVYDQIWVLRKYTDPIPLYPRIRTYVDLDKNCLLTSTGSPTSVDTSKCTGLKEQSYFQYTDTIYIRAFVKDKYSWSDDLGGRCDGVGTGGNPVRDASAAGGENMAWVNAHSGDIEINDLVGGIQVKKLPGTSPVSNYYNYSAYQGPLPGGLCWRWDDGYQKTVNPDSKYSPPKLDDIPKGEHSYILSINLTRRTQSQWVAGTNWYILRLRTIMDCSAPPAVSSSACTPSTSKESYTGLTLPIRITAPASVFDVVGTTRQQGGNTPRSTYWWDNTDDWVEHQIDTIYRADPVTVATGDINGDNRDDVVVGTAIGGGASGNLVIYYNLDFGRTWRRQFLTVGVIDHDEPYGVAVADLDNDGDGDIAAEMHCDNAAQCGGILSGPYVIRNDGSWTATPLTATAGGNDLGGGADAFKANIAIGDIDGDGFKDIITIDKDGDVNKFINKADDRAGFNAGVDVTTTAVNGCANGQRSAANRNGLVLARMEGTTSTDPDLDIVTHTSSGDKLMVWANNGAGVFTAYCLTNGGGSGFSGSGTIFSIDTGDLNADGRRDIAIGLDNNGAADYNVRWYRGPAAFGVAGWTETKIATNAYADRMEALVVADTDSDGDLDIVSADYQLNAGGPTNIWQYRNEQYSTSWTEIAIDTDAFARRGERVYDLAVGYIGL